MSENCWMSGKQYRPWSDAMFCSFWSGSTLFAEACLSEYLGRYGNYVVGLLLMDLLDKLQYPNIKHEYCIIIWKKFNLLSC